jgi:hypothetical protein
VRHYLRNFSVAWLFDWRVWSVAVAAALIWVAHFDRWSVASWQIPTDYYADAQETLARLKASSEGDVWPLCAQVISRLGAPFGAHWNAYPAPDKPLMLALGGLVHVFGLFATANIGLLLAQITSALAFYFTARWLRCRWEWSAAGALLFAYTYHTFHRGLSHFSLVFTWTVPLGLAAVWLVAGSRRLAWRRPGAVACLGAAVALGASNPYNLFFWLQLMGWAVAWQCLRDRRRENVQIGLATIAVALAAFAAMHAETWLHVDSPDALPLLARNYGGTEMYALKPVEFFIPPPFHHWDFLAFFGQRYTRWSDWRGEVFLPYLGLVGIGGLVWLVLASIRRLAARRTLPGQALSLTWILAYATIGGLTNVLALFASFQVFRATNRAAIFVSALVLFFLIGRLSRLSARWPAGLRLAAAAALAAIGVYDQLPRPESPADRSALAAAVRADQQFGPALESALPAEAMVFQLPVLGFPEVQPPYRLGDYEHFRPYLATNHLRFSYGAPKTRARSRWQGELASLPTAELVAQLEADGFAALYVNRKGYEDGAEKLLGDLDALGYTKRIVSAAGHQVVVPLHPVADPAPPLAHALTFGQGWHQRAVDGWHWAFGDAALAYFNPFPHPLTIDLQLTVMGATPGEIFLERNGAPISRVDAGAAPVPVVLRQMELAPGVNRFKLRSSQRAVRQGPDRNQLRSFGLRDVCVRVSADTPRRARPHPAQPALPVPDATISPGPISGARIAGGLGAKGS